VNGIKLYYKIRARIGRSSCCTAFSAQPNLPALARAGRVIAAELEGREQEVLP